MAVSFHITPCQRDNMRLRIKEILKDKGQTSRDFAEAMDLDAGQVSRFITGKRRANTEFLAKAAEILDVSVADLFEREQIPIVGYVSAGAEIYPYDDHEKGGGLDYIDAPPDCPPSAIAVRVRGTSMYPVYPEGDILVYDGQHRHIQELYGKRCIVGMPDGRRFVKTVEQGSTDMTVTLASFNAPPMVDVVIEWAARILWTRPS